MRLREGHCPGGNHPQQRDHPEDSGLHGRICFLERLCFLRADAQDGQAAVVPVAVAQRAGRSNFPASCRSDRCAMRASCSAASCSAVSSGGLPGRISSAIVNGSNSTPEMLPEKRTLKPE
jgi:hypothetical protein